MRSPDVKRNWERCSDAELLVDGDADAFSVFYVRHVRGVAGYLRSRTTDAQLVGDLTAEVFAAALLQRRRYRPDRAEASAWLRAIASNKLNDALRHGYAEARACKRLGLERVEVTPHDAVLFARAAQETGVGRLLDELPSDQREAVIARVVAEDDYEEIAMRTATTAANVRQRVRRGLSTLRGKMEREP